VTQSSRATVRRILIVEDEWLIADLLEHVLVDAGFGISGQVGRVKDALALIEVAEFDGALLDVRLNGELSFPIARRLIERNIPFLFLTGHITADVPDEFRRQIFLKKPVGVDALIAHVNALFEAP
jgi:DNA-binding response OmpR family regulator